MTALAYLKATVTQSGADVFTQGEMQTALTGISNVAYRVREIIWQITTAVSSVNDSNVGAVLSRRSKTSAPNAGDSDVIALFNRYAKLTTSGAYQVDRVIRQVFSEDDEVLIVEDPLYLIVASGTTAVANGVVCRVGYERVSISALDRLTLLTASLD